MTRRVGIPGRADGRVLSVGGSGAAITEGAYGSLPGSPADDDVYLVTDGHVLLHRASSAWKAFGPLHPLVLPPPVSGNWTWANQGTSTADDTMGPILMVSQVNGGQTLRALYKAAPGSTPYTITALVSWDMALGWPNWMGCGIGFRENSSGKYLMFGPSNAETGGAIAVMRWNSTGGYTSNYFNDQSYGVYRAYHWLRISDDGSNLNFYYSSSGLQWYLRYSSARNNFFTTAPDGVAIMLYQEHGSIQSQAAFWSWEVT